MIRVALPEDVEPVAAAIPAAGVRELAEVYGMTPAQAVANNFAQSVGHRWTMWAADVPLAMFGVMPLGVLGGIGEFYITGTTHICAHRFAFARMCKRFLPELLAHWTELRGALEHDRADVVKWADWLGVKRQRISDRISLMVLSESS